MRNRNCLKRSGFTLVELLIVIVVIGVLSTMMMLSSTEAVSSAKANNIISNLRNWKTATLEWYTDNIDKVNTSTGKVKNSSGTDGYFSQVVKAKDILPYLGGGLEIDGDNVKDASGGIYETGYYNNRDWTIIYTLPPGDKDNASLLPKIEARADSLGLMKYHYSYTKPYKVEWNGNKPSNSYRIAIIAVDFSQ